MQQLTRVLGAAALLAAGFTASASAATVTVRFDANIFNAAYSPGHDAVRLTYPNGQGSGSANANVHAGRFQGPATAFTGVDASIFVDSVDDLFLYCYDLYESIQGGRSVNYTIDFDGETARTLDFLGAVNAVFNQARGTQDTYAWLHPVNAAQAAAVQLGIWESLYDSSANWSMSAGAFSATQLDSGTELALNGFFAAMPAAPSLDGRYAMVLRAANAQDMLVGDPPSQVPAPGGIALVGLAAAAAFAARRRALRR